jgi:hypothetical protein
VSDFSRNGHGLGILLDGGLDDVGGRPIIDRDGSAPVACRIRRMMLIVAS